MTVDRFAFSVETAKESVPYRSDSLFVCEILFKAFYICAELFVVWAGWR
jgi:hypothetical protein